jgi:putative transcriptional regulator
MSNIKSIRERLKLTQSALAEGMGCTQGNVGHYEKGQTVPPDAARRLIEFAHGMGHTVTFEDIYGHVVKRTAKNHPGQRATDKPRAK